MELIYPPLPVPVNKNNLDEVQVHYKFRKCWRKRQASASRTSTLDLSIQGIEQALVVFYKIPPKCLAISLMGCLEARNYFSDHPLICCDYSSAKGLVGIHGRVGEHVMTGPRLQVWRLPSVSSFSTFSCFWKYTLNSFFPLEIRY